MATPAEQTSCSGRKVWRASVPQEILIFWDILRLSDRKYNNVVFQSRADYLGNTKRIIAVAGTNGRMLSQPAPRKEV